MSHQGSPEYIIFKTKLVKTDHIHRSITQKLRMSQQRSLTTKERPWGPEGRGGPCGALSHPPPPQRWADANKKGCCGPGSHPVTAGPALHTGHSRRLLVDTMSAAFRMGPPGPGGRTRGASHSSLTAALSLRQLQHARLSKPSVPPSPSIALHHPPSPSIALHRSPSLLR